MLSTGQTTPISNVDGILCKRSHLRTTPRGDENKIQVFRIAGAIYRQEVIFNSKGIETAECSCPVGDGGHCKHTIALLLTWVNDPDSFQETEALDTILEKRSKPELIAIIKEMLEQEPDLDSILDLPIIGEESKPINIKAIRQQAQRTF